MGERIGVPDEESALSGPLLPPERGWGCRPAGDNLRAKRLFSKLKNWRRVATRYDKNGRVLPRLCHARFNQPVDTLCPLSLVFGKLEAQLKVYPRRRP